jgi:hypothetical protein
MKRHHSRREVPAGSIQSSVWTREVRPGVEWNRGREARAIVIVKTYCRTLRRAWHDACYKLKINCEEVRGADSSEPGIRYDADGQPVKTDDKHRHTTTYDCVGSAWALNKLIGWDVPGMDTRYAGPIVEFHYACAARVPVLASGNGPEKVKASTRPAKEGKWHGESGQDYDRCPPTSEGQCIRRAEQVGVKMS